MQSDERSRQLHRDSMHRHRQRRAQNIAVMRATLDQLTRQFQQLGLWAVGTHQLLMDYREITQSPERLQREQLELERSVVVLVWQKALGRLSVLLAEYY